MEKVINKVQEQSDSSKAAANRHITGSERSGALSDIPQIQFRLTIGHPDDKYEQEADRTSKQIMSMPEPVIVQEAGSIPGNEESITKPHFPAITPLILRQPEEEELIEKIEDSDDSQILGTSLENSLSQTSGKGSPLPEDARGFMESRFGTDFSNVRLHTDDNSVRLNKQLNAQAFTKGSDIYFNEGKYNPDSSQGKFLLAHELTHVLQQNSAVSYKKEDPYIMREVRGMVEQQREGRNLNDREWDVVRRSLINARRMVQRTISFIRGVHNLLLPGFDPRLHSEREINALTMFRAHYKNPGPVDGLEAQEYFGYINTALNALSRNSFRVITDRQANEESDGDTYAYVRGRDPVIYIAESYFTELAADEEYARSGARVSVGPRLLNDSQKARILIHETAHFRLGVVHSGGVFGFDTENPVHGLPIRTAAQGLNNAYVYDHFAFCASVYGT